MTGREQLCADDFLNVLIAMRTGGPFERGRDPLKYLANKLENIPFADLSLETQQALHDATQERYPTRRRKTADTKNRLGWLRKKLRAFWSLDVDARSEVRLLCEEVYNRLPISDDNPREHETGATEFSVANESGHVSP